MPIKQECYTRRSNIKFFGIKDNDEESPSDTEETLRHFLTKEMKIPRGDVDKIEFERVHRIPTKPSTEKKPNPRPIIAKVSFYQDKELIKSHIKNLKKGSKLGVADDYPKEVEQIRKDLQPALKKARQEKKLAFFNVEKLIIDGKIYRGPETNGFLFMVDSWKAEFPLCEQDKVVSAKTFQVLEFVSVPVGFVPSEIIGT